MDGVWRDVRYAVRTLAVNRGFTAVAALTLGLGVGSTTAMFSAVDAVLLRELAYDDPASIVVLREADSRDGSLKAGVSAANARDVASMSRTLAHVSIANTYGFTLLEDGRARSVRGFRVSSGFFEATGADVVLGRTLLPEEFADGGEGAVVLSHRSWLTRFGGDTTIVGRQLVLDGTAHRVVGVLEPGFKYPAAAELYSPRPPRPWDAEARGAAQMHGVARVRSGASVADAQAELDRIGAELVATNTAIAASTGFRVTPLREHMFDDVRSPLALLLGAVGLVLLIASANVAGIQLARGVGRSQEFALRAALGAGARRILRLTLLESLLLGLLGAALGAGFAVIGVDAIRWLVPPDVPRIDELRVDAAALVFSMAISIFAALASGVAPALLALGTRSQRAVEQSSARSVGNRRAGAFRDRLVVSEIALALVLMIGAGLLVRSFDRLVDNDLGFDPEHRLAVQVFAYDESDRPDLEFVRVASDEIAALPGVESVGVTTAVPLADNESIWRMAGEVAVGVEGRVSSSPDADRSARLVAIDGDYPHAMGVAVEAGRGFTDRDGPGSAPVALVNEAFVRRYLTGPDPVGSRIVVGSGAAAPREVVGVLADVRPEGFDSDPEPEVYVPFHQTPTTGGVTFVIRTTTDPAIYANAVRDALWDVDPGQSIWASRPVPDLLADWTRQRRFNTTLLSTFAVLALVLAGIGVYGLMSFSVEQRTNELGIRRALGGHARDVMTMTLGRGLRLALAGVGLGLVACVALHPLLEAMLFGVGPFDPLTFASVSVFVVMVALLSTAIPAKRATAVDPMVALRGK